MDDYHISAFIDDQLELEEKIEFVETVHADRSFKEEAVSLLRQEVRLRTPVVEPVRLPVKIPRPLRFVLPPLKRLAYFGGGLVTAILMMAVYIHFHAVPPMVENPHRFVLYQPEAQQASIMGTFSDWRKLEMHRAGDSGYWEITVNLPPGEYRYTFLLDQRRRMPDPTLPVCEQDDFGGLNSILTIHSRASA